MLKNPRGIVVGTEDVILRKPAGTAGDRGIALHPRQFTCLGAKAIPRRFAPQDDAFDKGC